MHLLNPLPNNSSVLRVCSTSLLKTLWEKEKLLVTSNFSFPKVLLQETTPSSIASSRFEIQYLTAALGRILFIKISGYGIGFSTRRPWFKSCPNLIFLPCIYSFLSLLQTLFVRVFSTHSENFLPFSSNLKLSSANPYSLE